MKNFEFYNPTRIIFGRDMIKRLSKYLPADAHVLLCYGGGSVKQNGVYDQVVQALSGREYMEFGGIEPNPEFDTLMKAVVLGRENGVDFILAVGGGSVIDGSKFIAAAIPCVDDDPWKFVTGEKELIEGEVLPVGTVLTLPATGSEMNGVAVVSRRATQEKYAFRGDAIYPRFSIMDPTATYSLPEKQVRNGVVDAYIHVMEQYATYPVDARIQDRHAEGILLTLQEIGKKALQTPPDYDTRANLMWAATNALNKQINKGVPEDWASHMIGHELTAFYGLDHAESLAVIMPHLLWYQRKEKAEKLTQYAHRIWGLTGEGEGVIRSALDRMISFFHRVKMPTTLTAFRIDPDEAADRVRARFEARGIVLGEWKSVTPEVAAEIIRMSQ
jgi:NADP-dependent alcohol dehydrogenase